MHVGLIIYGDLSITSGGYLYDWQLVQYLQNQGDEVEIISLPWRNYGRHLLDNLNLNLAHRLRESDFDVILQDELNHPSLFWLNRRLRRQLSTPVISIVHHLRSSEQHPNWQLRLFRRVEKNYLRSVDGFIFNSKTTKAAVQALARQDKPNVVAYPAGNHVSDSTLSQAAILERVQHGGPLRLLFVGNIIHRKGLHILLAALAKLPQDVWRLDVIGDLDVDRKYAENMMALAESSAGDAALSSNITWHGRLSNAELTEKMAASDVLVVPSSYEGFGIAYLEAMCYGLPAIGTTSGAAHEIIQDGQNGFLIGPDDALSLTYHIETLHKDRQLLTRMSLAALDRSRKHPTWEMSMQIIREFLLSVTHTIKVSRK